MINVAASYERLIGGIGETITIRRYTGSGNRTRQDADVRARVTGYEPQELIGAIQQGDRRLIVLAKDLYSAQWPCPPRFNDKAVIRGREVNIEAVDDSSRRVDGELIAYEIRVRG